MLDKRKQHLAPFSAFFHAFPAISYDPGDTILDAWEKTSYIFCIEQGYVKDYTIVANGDQRIRVYLGENDIFPLASLVYHRDHTIYETATKVVVRKAPRYHFLQFLHEQPGLMRPLLYQALVAEKVITILEHPDAYTRLATRLALLISIFGKYDGTGEYAEIQLPISHADLAASCNMTRETASRLLRKMHDEEIIWYKPKFMKINLHKLYDRLSLGYDYHKRLMEYLVDLDR